MFSLSSSVWGPFACVSLAMGLLACGGGDTLKDSPDDRGDPVGAGQPDGGSGSSACELNHGGCHIQASCEDRGSAGIECTCQPGFTGDGKNCEPARGACAQAGVCDPHAICKDSAGSVSCTCGEGYEGDGKTCTALDDCAVDRGGCGEHEVCLPLTPGTHTCTCAPGYIEKEGDCVAPGALCERELGSGVADVGKACSAGSNLALCAVGDDTCSSGVCVLDTFTDAAYCTAGCDGTPETECPSGFACVQQDCSSGPQYVCARIEVTATDCVQVSAGSNQYVANWFGATTLGFEYAFMLDRVNGQNQFWARQLGEGDQGWTPALSLETEEPGKVSGVMFEQTRVVLGGETFVAFNRGIFRLERRSVTREPLGDAETTILGVFRNGNGAVRAVVRESDGRSVFYTRTAAGVWEKGAVTPQPITHLEAFDGLGFLAACGADEHLCEGGEGDTLKDIAMPAGESFAGLRQRKPLVYGHSKDFRLVTASGSVLRRNVDGDFVRDALPESFARSLSEDDLGRAGFTRAGEDLYLFLPHTMGDSKVVSAFLLKGDCWQPVSAPLSLLSYGVRDGSIRFYNSSQDLLCNVVPTLP